MAGLPTRAKNTGLPQIYRQQQAEIKRQKDLAVQRVKEQEVAQSSYSQQISTLPTEIQEWAKNIKNQTGSYPSIDATNKKISDYNAFSQGEYDKAQAEYDRQLAEYNAQVAAEQAEVNAKAEATRIINQAESDRQARITAAVKSNKYGPEPKGGWTWIPELERDDVPLTGNPLVDKYIRETNERWQQIKSDNIQAETARNNQILYEKQVALQKAELTKPVNTLSTTSILSTGILGGTKDYLKRSDITLPQDLGDETTQNLVAQGYSVEQALNKQMTEATNKRGANYYRNELDKALQSNVGLSSAYHHWAADTGLPQAVNPYENVGDISLAIKQGNIKGSLQGLPSALSVLGLLPQGKSVQQVGWDNAVSNEKKLLTTSYPSFASALSVLDIARSTKDLGIYGTLKSTSGGKTLTLPQQQSVASKIFTPTLKEGSTIYGGYNQTELSEFFSYGKKTKSPSNLPNKKGLTENQISAIDWMYNTGSLASKQFFEQAPSVSQKIKGTNLYSNIAGNFVNTKEEVTTEPEKVKGLLYISPSKIEVRPQALGETVSDVTSAFDQLFGYNKKTGYLSVPQENVLPVIGSVGKYPLGITGSIGAVNQGLARLTTLNAPDISAIPESTIGKVGILATTMGGGGALLSSPVGKDVSNFYGGVLKSIYSESRENPLEDIAFYLSPAVLKGAKLGAAKGVAKTTLSSNMYISDVGRLLSTPAASELAKVAEWSALGILAYPGVEKVVKSKTPTEAGSAVGELVYPLVWGGLGMDYAKPLYNEQVYNPYKGVTFQNQVRLNQPVTKTKVPRLESLDYYSKNLPTVKEMYGYNRATAKELNKLKAEQVKINAIEEELLGKRQSRFVDKPAFKVTKASDVIEKSYKLPFVREQVPKSTFIKAGKVAVGGALLGAYILNRNDIDKKYPYASSLISGVLVGGVGVGTKTRVTVEEPIKYTSKYKATLRAPQLESLKTESLSFNKPSGVKVITTVIPKSTPTTKQVTKYTTSITKPYGVGVKFKTVENPVTNLYSTVEQNYKPKNKIKVITTTLHPYKNQTYTTLKTGQQTYPKTTKVTTAIVPYDYNQNKSSTPPKKREYNYNTIKYLQPPINIFGEETTTPPIIKYTSLKITKTTTKPKPPSDISTMVTLMKSQTTPYKYPTLTYEDKHPKKRRKHRQEKPSHWEYGYGAEVPEAAQFVLGRAEPEKPKKRQQKRTVTIKKRTKKQMTGSWLDKVLR